MVHDITLFYSGSYVSSLKCIRTGCDGLMLTVNPMLVKAFWKCNQCQLKLDYSRVSRIHDILSQQVYKIYKYLKFNFVEMFLFRYLLKFKMTIY